MTKIQYATAQMLYIAIVQLQKCIEEITVLPECQASDLA